MLSVVIVDDEGLNLQLLERLIVKSGLARVVGAFTKPTEALKKIGELNPDAVFLDIEMPEMNGLELALHLTEENEDLNVVFVTAYSRYALEAFKVNALNYILKPVYEEDLVKTLKRIGKLSENRVRTPGAGAIRVKCFGRFEILKNDGTSVKWMSYKAMEMMAYFILHHNDKIDKWEIGEALWPESSGEKLTGNFHTTLYRLRQTLKEESIPIRILSVKGSREGYICSLDTVGCDAIAFENLMEKGGNKDEEILDIFEKMRLLYQGYLLKDMDYLWCLPVRERFTAGFSRAAIRAAECHMEKQQYPQALEVIRNGLVHSPYDEELNRFILDIYYQQKDRGAIISHYLGYKSLLRSELNTEPDLFTQKAYIKYLSTF